ncbi:MAG: hypothetical protein MHMPM18_002603 [Marteilia pararefringens]
MNDSEQNGNKNLKQEELSTATPKVTLPEPHEKLSSLSETDTSFHQNSSHSHDDTDKTEGTEESRELKTQNSIELTKRKREIRGKKNLNEIKRQLKMGKEGGDKSAYKKVEEQSEFSEI